jgi:hypothetical protein
MSSSGRSGCCSADDKPRTAQSIDERHVGAEVPSEFQKTSSGIKGRIRMGFSTGSLGFFNTGLDNMHI